MTETWRNRAPAMLLSEGGPDGCPGWHPMTPDTHTAGTGAIHAPAAQPIVPEPGERVRCAVCGSEDRWRHEIPTPRRER